MFFNKHVHELVTIDTDFIDARFNYENYVPVCRETSVTLYVAGRL